MQTYRIEFEKPALKFIQKQPKPQRIRIMQAIQALPSGDVKKLKGDNELYRLRVGDYRVVYKIDDGLLLITVVNAGNRGQIYREL